MADERFFRKNGPFPLSALAELTGAELRGNAGAEMTDVAPLETAGAKELSFLSNTKYVEAFTASKAGACFVSSKLAGKAPQGMALLVTEEPYVAYAKAAQLFYPPSQTIAGIAPGAKIDPSAKISDSACVEHGAVIGAGVEIGARCHVGANSVIAEGVVLGADCRVDANCSISHAIIGNKVNIYRGCNIGQDGFGFAPSSTGIIKVPQLGRVVIGNDVEIGAGTCIDRGAGPDTVIGNGVKIDNLVQIGHNCRIGNHAIIVSQVGIAGSSVIEDGAMIGGQAGIAGHLTVGRGAKIAAQSGVMRDVPAGEEQAGSPAMPIKETYRQLATLARLVKEKRK